MLHITTQKKVEKSFQKGLLIINAGVIIRLQIKLNKEDKEWTKAKCKNN